MQPGYTGHEEARVWKWSQWELEEEIDDTLRIEAESEAQERASEARGPEGPATRRVFVTGLREP